MTTITSTYRFLPWTRRGLADKIKGADTGAALPIRAKVPVGLTVTGSTEAKYDLSLYGPGDVIGVDTTLIVRTDPRPYATDVEANFFTAIEFDAPDFPWLFTPAISGTNNKLRPWCVLIVVDLSIVDPPHAQPGHPLPVIVIPAEARATELPDLADSWAWAHTQVVAPSTGTTATTLAASLSDDPSMNVARIVAPRRLEPGKQYAACLVPAFDAGVSRGLIGTAPITGNLGAAWSDATPGDVQLPVYYHWEFSTGPAGDFETLARRLKPAVPPETAGVESMYIGDAGPELPAIPSTDPSGYLDMDGPLRAPKRSNATLADVPAAFQSALQTTLNAASDQAQSGPTATTPVLGPPIYGEWPANQHTIPAATPAWLRELNLDPRTRAAAGLGAEIERKNQEDFVQWSWEQVGDILKANALLNQARLSMETLNRVHTRHVATLPADRALQFSAPLHARAFQGGVTIKAAIEQSSLPNASGDPALRRLVSPANRFMRSAMRRAPAPPAPVAPPVSTPPTGGATSSVTGVGTVAGATTKSTGTTAPTTAPTTQPAASASLAAPVAGKVTKAAAITASTTAATTSTASTAATSGAVKASIAVSAPIAVIATMAVAPVGASVIAQFATGPATGPAAGTPVSVDPTRFVPNGLAGSPESLGYFGPIFNLETSLSFAGLPSVVFRDAVLGLQSVSQVGLAAPLPPAPTLAAMAAFVAPPPPAGGTVGPPASVATSAAAIAAAATAKVGTAPTTTGATTTAAISKAAAAVAAAPTAAATATTATAAPIAAPTATTPPAPPFVPFALSAAKDSLVARTNPRATVVARIQSMLKAGGVPMTSQPTFQTAATRLSAAAAPASGVAIAPTFDRIMAAPELDAPVYRYLADLDPTRFMPGVGDVPPDSIMLLETNPRFIEALLVGLNSEMNRELLWREFPTDQRGTPFKHFWGWSDGGADITAINTWDPANVLGANSRSGSGGQIVMLIRGRLLQRYPNTSIFAWRAKGTKLITSPAATDIRNPVFTGVLGTDIAFAGFDLTDVDLAQGDGWFFVLQEQPTEPRFGFDEGTGAPAAALTSWSDATWDDTGTAPGHYLRLTGNRLSGVTISSARFVDHSAHLAFITVQKPVCVAVHSHSLLSATTP